MSSQRIGKYACLEIERKLLLEKPPIVFDENSDGWLIVDRYFPNTRLRLRSMKSILGNEVSYKLTQKYQSETQDPYQTTITNMYLTKMEYRYLETIEAMIIKKRRYQYKVQNRNFSIDIFEGRHEGLILAEIEFEKESELSVFTLPQFAIKDVTDDPFFIGGNLVVMSGEAFRQGFAKYTRVC